MKKFMADSTLAVELPQMRKKAEDTDLAVHIEQLRREGEIDPLLPKEKDGSQEVRDLLKLNCMTPY